MAGCGQGREIRRFGLQLALGFAALALEVGPEASWQGIRGGLVAIAQSRKGFCG